jgi:hypothetical protein
MDNQPFDDNLVALQKFGTKIRETKKSKPFRIKDINKVKNKTSVKKKKFDFRNKNLMNLVIGFCRRVNEFHFPKIRKINFNLFSKKSKLNKQQFRFRLIETRKQRGNKTIIIRQRVRVRSIEQVPTRKTIQKTLIDPPIQNSLYAFQSKPSIWDINIDHESDKSTFLNIFSEIT